MTRDEVIEGLKHCTILKKCYGCPYHMGDSAECINVLMRDIIALLKAEPKRGRWIEEPDSIRRWHCSGCGYIVAGIEAKIYKYCPKCGSQNNMEDKA